MMKNFTVLGTFSKHFIFLNSFRQCRHANIKTIPSTIICINDNAFDSIFDTVFPNLHNVERIGTLSFASNLYQTVSLPASLKFLGDSAFSNDNIELITFPEDSKLFSKDEYGSLYDYDKKRLLWASHVNNFVIPMTVTKIPWYVFISHSFTTITIPPRVSHIDQRAFFKCLNLKTVIITGDKVTIESNSFEQAVNIEQIHYYGTHYISPITLEEKMNFKVYVCSQYKWEKAFGVSVNKTGNCFQRFTCFVHRTNVHLFIFCLSLVL